MSDITKELLGVELDKEPVPPKAPSNVDPDLEAKAAAELAEKAAADKADADKAEADKLAADEKPKEDEPKEDEPKPEVWEDTGNESGNAVIDLLKTAGVSQEDAKSMMYDAIVAGDPTKVDMKALTEKLGESGAFLAKQGIDKFIADRADTVQAAAVVAHEVAGGEENWVKVRDWAGDNISDDDMAEYVPMIDAGGAQQRFALGEIMKKYNADDKNSDLAPAREEADLGNNTPPAIEPLGKVAYSDAYDKAYNDRSLNDKQRAIKLASISKARAAGRAAGL